MNARHEWIEKCAELSVLRQCELLQVNRSRLYYQPVDQSRRIQEDQLLCKLINKAYSLYPFYGTRRMVVHLRGLGYTVNRKRVRRLMTKIGLKSIAPGPNTSKPHPQHKVYPYLLRGVDINEPNQVWGTDITYLRLNKGFVYLVAVMDWYSRRVLSWRISNTMDSQFCVDCLEEALQQHGNLKIGKYVHYLLITPRSFRNS